MKDYSDIEARLEEYSHAFDFYLKWGEFPAPMAREDCLLVYMKEVIDNNPQIDGADSTWLDVMKEGLISYFYQLLKSFHSIQKNAENELKYIEEFERARVDKKRKMWGEVYKFIKNR